MCMFPMWEKYSPSNRQGIPPSIFFIINVMIRIKCTYDNLWIVLYHLECFYFLNERIVWSFLSFDTLRSWFSRCEECRQTSFFPKKSYFFYLSRPPDHFYTEQEAHGPHRSPEKTVQINKHIWLNNNLD